MTTDDETTLLQAVIDNPDDDAPRLAYADWCDRRGDPRGRFIRVQVELAPIEYNRGNPRRRPLLDESMTLLAEHGREWLPSQNPYIFGCKMHRGFVASVTVSATSFLRHFTELAALYPIQCVEIPEMAPHAHAVLTSSHLKKITALSVNRGGITDDDLKAFSHSQFVQNMWWLDLSDNQISQEGVAALITSPYLRKLGYVWLEGNPCNPIETAGFDQGSLVDRQMPEAGRQLEARFGPIRWLKFRDTPSPFGPLDEP